MSKPTSQKIKRLYAVVSVIVLTAILFAVPSFAADFDTSGLLDGVETALIAVLSIVGGGLAIFGVVNLIEAQSSNDPNAKSQGVKMMAAGLGVIMVANIAIPVFIAAISLD